MLKKLSYLNLGMAVAYYVMFLTNGSVYVVAWILSVALLNGLVLRSLQEELPFNWIHYLLCIVNLCFVGFLSIGLVHIVKSSITYDYFGNSWFYILLTSVFILSIVVHFILIFLNWRH
ncbi:hypothetical protein PBAL39_10656 [Pedobacter sp. BAL39]|uniref:hypothetical protein n=1 Tax=Pedobacter sp. BAL39 TaxID=391596 RepID=UPI00015598EF|nr:hypothetical protein [Pedobacter sp. BAL39]EDM37599.1 hypothetical protein PBAL39_10656 [Pedobacter sp. BAL39]